MKEVIILEKEEYEELVRGAKNTYVIFSIVKDDIYNIDEIIGFNDDEEKVLLIIEELKERNKGQNFSYQKVEKSIYKGSFY